MSEIIFSNSGFFHVHVFRWLILFFLFCFLFFFSNFPLEFHLISHTKITSSFRGCSCTCPISTLLSLPSNHLMCFNFTNKFPSGCEVRVQSIEICGKKTGNGNGVAFIHSTAGRYTATACATSASSSTWPIPCHRLSLSNSTLPPLISMLTVSLCHTIFLPALHTTLSLTL